MCSRKQDPWGSPGQFTLTKLREIEMQEELPLLPASPFLPFEASLSCRSHLGKHLVEGINKSEDGLSHEVLLLPRTPGPAGPVRVPRGGLAAQSRERGPGL